MARLALHNLLHNVVAYFVAAPDLVITEFSKDVSMAIDAVHNSYRELAALFRLIGSEWAILTPGYVRAGPRSPCSFWMLGMEAENGLVMEEDPRPCVIYVSPN